MGFLEKEHRQLRLEKHIQGKSEKQKLTIFNNLSDGAGKKSDESVLTRLGIGERDVGGSVEGSTRSGFVSKGVEVVGESRVGLGENI